MTTTQNNTGHIETFSGELVRFRAVNAAGWGIGELVIDGSRRGSGSVPITGTLVGVDEGDRVEIEGRWSTHPKYGEQFKVRRCTPLRPQGPDGAVRWIVSRLPSVGERRAREMVRRFGGDLWRVLEREPEKLAEISGITLPRAKAISSRYQDVAHEREHMVTLRGWDLTDNQVARCVEVWGDLGEVVRRLRENPYLLSREVFGFGFKRADVIARRMGIAKDSPHRIRAAIEFVLEEAVLAGHCFLWGAALQRMTAELLGIEPKLVGKQALALVEEGRVVRRGARVYLRRMDAAERACADGIQRLLQAHARIENDNAGDAGDVEATA